MLRFSRYLAEYAKGDGKPTAKKHPLENHFHANSNGSFDNLSWKKDDVGRYSNPFKDSHGFVSVYLRFKGSKTARLIPEIIFKKHFKTTGIENAVSSKWLESNKGGTKIKTKERAQARMDKKSVERAIRNSMSRK